MIIDYLVINLTNIYLFSIILSVFKLNKGEFIIILIFDILINKIPLISLIIMLLYCLNNFIFKYLNNNFRNKYILIMIYYFIFGITLYSIYNTFDLSIISILIKNLPINLIYYFFGLKIIDEKYN